MGYTYTIIVNDILTKLVVCSEPECFEFGLMQIIEQWNHRHLSGKRIFWIWTLNQHNKELGGEIEHIENNPLPSKYIWFHTSKTVLPV